MKKFNVITALVLAIVMIFTISASSNEMAVNSRLAGDDGPLTGLENPDIRNIETGIYYRLTGQKVKTGMEALNHAEPSLYTIKWGESFKSVRNAHPSAAINSARNWVLNKVGLEFFGFPAQSIMFSFNGLKQFCGVSAVMRSGIKEVEKKLISLFGAPAGAAAAWQKNGVEISVRGVETNFLVTIINKKLAAIETAKDKKSKK